MKQSISVVIPVYNGEKTLENLYIRLEKVLDSITESFEIILVDDASKDNSFIKMNQLNKKDKRVKVISFEENYGQQNAILCGLRYAKGDVVFTMDDDLQNPPEEMTKILKELHKGYDVVYGIPKKKQHSIYRNLGTKMTDLFFRVVFKKGSNIRISSFRGMKKTLVEKIIKDNRDFVYISATTFLYTSNVGNVLVRHDERNLGKSNYSIYKLFALYGKLFLYYSPLSKLFRKQKNLQYKIGKYLI